MDTLDSIEFAVAFRAVLRASETATKNQAVTGNFSVEGAHCGLFARVLDTSTVPNKIIAAVRFNVDKKRFVPDFGDRSQESEAFASLLNNLIDE